MENTKKLKLIETFSSTTIALKEDSIKNEALQHDSRVDGKYIIGMIEGQFFKPDGMSRNKRWYPKELWEKALSGLDVKNKFATSTMFGEIGHSDGPVEDMTLRNGCASHFVDKLWIDQKGRGMGRAYILNTPTGNLLKTYLGAGCKLKVSTRGEGFYKEGATHEGCPIVDPDSYELQTADFVLNPGFIETSANLREEYNKVEENIQTNKEQIEETIAHITQEGEKRMALDIEAYVAELKEELKSVKAENKTLNEQLQAKEKELLQKEFGENAEIKSLNEEIGSFKKLHSSAKTLKESFERSQTLLKKERAEKVSIQEELETYKAKCGTLDQVDEAVTISTKSLKMIEEYRKFGTPEDIKTLAEQATKMMENLKKIRASKNLMENRSRKLLETYKKIGSPKEIERLIENVNRVTEELKEAKKLEVNASKLLEEVKASKKLEKVCESALRKLKSMKKLNESVESKVEMKEEKEEKAPVVNEALELSQKFDCTVESAAKLVKSHGLQKAEEILESTKEEVSEKVELKESIELVEEEAKLDAKAEKASSNEFLKAGVVKSYFDNASLGAKKVYELNNIKVDNSERHEAAKELLKKYSAPVEEAPKVEAPKTEEEAEKEVKNLV